MVKLFKSFEKTLLCSLENETIIKLLSIYTYFALTIKVLSLKYFLLVIHKKFSCIKFT